MDESSSHALALCLIYGHSPARCAGLYLLAPGADVRLVRHPEAGQAGARAELSQQGADLVLAIPDPFMSSQHAVLRRDGKGQLRADDLGSKNGTRLGGVPLRHGSRPLREGDDIETGRALLRLLTVNRPSRGQREDDLRDRVFEKEPQRVVAAWPGTLSPTLRRVLGTAERVPSAKMPVLIQGEPGTGKRALAQHLHDRCTLAGLRGPLIAAPPGGRLPLRDLHAGTLFIEDVGRLTVGDQLDLLRLLRGELRGRGPVQCIATTDIDLGVLARGGAFRPDLLLHLGAVTLALPPLRERKEDLGLLCEFYLGRIAAELLGPPGATDREAPALHADTWRRVFAYDWPGNQSELFAVLKQALRRARAANRQELEPGDLPETIRHGFSDPALPGLGPPMPWVPIVATSGEGPALLPQPAEKEARREALVQALQAEGGKVARAARRLGLSRVHVHRLARQLGINLEEFRVRRTTRKI